MLCNKLDMYYGECKISITVKIFDYVHHTTRKFYMVDFVFKVKKKIMLCQLQKVRRSSTTDEVVKN